MKSDPRIQVYRATSFADLSPPRERRPTTPAPLKVSLADVAKRDRSVARPPPPVRTPAVAAPVAPPTPKPFVRPTVLLHADGRRWSPESEEPRPDNPNIRVPESMEEAMALKGAASAEATRFDRLLSTMTTGDRRRPSLVAQRRALDEPLAFWKRWIKAENVRCSGNEDWKALIRGLLDVIEKLQEGEDLVEEDYALCDRAVERVEWDDTLAKIALSEGQAPRSAERASPLQRGFHRE